MANDISGGAQHKDETGATLSTGQDIDVWMARWRFSAVDLADRLGITTATLWAMRNNRTPIKSWVWLALAGIEREEDARLRERFGPGSGGDKSTNGG